MIANILISRSIAPVVLPRYHESTKATGGDLKRLSHALLFLTGIAAVGSGQQMPDSITAEPQRLYALPSEETPSFDAGEILSAFARAYPRRVDRVGWRNGDWAIRIADNWYHYAGGRLLPEEARGRSEEFDPYPFYEYPQNVPPLQRYSTEEAARLESLVTELEENPIRRHPGLLDALWRIDGPQSAWERQKTTYFLGHQTLVHREILEDLAAVEERVLQLARDDSEVARFVESIGSVYGYTYREVDGTDSLSYHAYGAAVDILPIRYDRAELYWRWARDAGVTWYTVPYSDRFTIPQAIVSAFEAHGFVWGGKWRFFDTIHFEYRPEILLLNGFEVEQR